MLYQNLFTIKPNETTGLYEITEGQYLYSLNSQSFNELKKHFKLKQVGLIDDWINSLGQEEKNRINKKPVSEYK